jgi:hypothetical protein
MGAPQRGTCGIMDDGERPPQAPGPGDGLSHLAFLYRGADEYLQHLLAFIREGLACSEPAFVALPDDLAWRVRATLGAADWQLAVADMNVLGRNPARITLALGAFSDQHAGHRIRIVTEPLWPGRTDAETAEVMNTKRWSSWRSPSSARRSCVLTTPPGSARRTSTVPAIPTR